MDKSLLKTLCFVGAFVCFLLATVGASVHPRANMIGAGCAFLTVALAL